MIYRIDTNSRMSQIVRHGGLVYLSGQVPTDLNGDSAAQSASVLNKIDGLLTENGTTRSDVLTATIYLADMADFAGMNGVLEDLASDRCDAHENLHGGETGKTEGPH